MNSRGAIGCEVTSAMNASRSSPRRQSGARARADDLARPGRLVDADQLLDASADVADVELVGDRVVDDGITGLVDLDPALPALADQTRSAAPQTTRRAFGACGRRPIARAARRRTARWSLCGLDQEPVAIADVGELVRERRLRRPHIQSWGSS